MLYLSIICILLSVAVVGLISAISDVSKRSKRDIELLESEFDTLKQKVGHKAGHGYRGAFVGFVDYDATGIYSEIADLRKYLCIEYKTEEGTAPKTYLVNTKSSPKK